MSLSKSAWKVMTPQNEHGMMFEAVRETLSLSVSGEGRVRFG